MLKKPKSAQKQRKTLIAKLDKLWSKKVRERDGSCQYPGCTVNATKLDAHHIFGKGAHPGLRWVLANGISLCVQHHRWGKFAAHHNEDAFREKCKFWFPERFMKLSIMQNNRVKRGLVVLKALLQEMEREAH